MKMPNAGTIRSKIDHYASKVGFTIIRNSDGSYTVFDVKMGYNVNTNVDMNTVVRVVHDDLYLKFAS